MAFFYLFLCLGVPGLVLLAWAFRIGLRALDMSKGQSGEYAATLRYLALNLCEPLVNTIIVGGFIWLTSALRWPESLALVWTAPMAVLLVPLRGRSFQDRVYRYVSMQILWHGVVRWVINFLSLSGVAAISEMHSGASSVVGFFCFLVLPLISIGFLIYCGTWGREQLQLTLAPPLAPLPRRPRIVPAVSARPAAAPPVFIPAAPAALDHTNAISCPICQELVWLEADSCGACGLVLLSRIPEALRSVPRFTVLRPIGGGGMSSVYLARDRSGGRLCVLKTIASVDARNDPAWREEATRCIQREAALLRQLSHPGIVPLVGFYSELEGDFLVMEHVAGPTFEQLLTRVDAAGNLIAGAALPPERALAYGARIADVLAYLSAQALPVVHCDVKPSNLILPPGGDGPVLVDFGSAVAVSPGRGQTLRLDRYGTPGYAAPEQYAGVALPQSDVYGLAATLYHLLTDDDPSAHPLAFPALARLPADIAALLAQALERDPSARPDARAFGAALSAQAASRPPIRSAA